MMFLFGVTYHNFWGNRSFLPLCSLHVSPLLLLSFDVWYGPLLWGGRYGNIGRNKGSRDHDHLLENSMSRSRSPFGKLNVTITITLSRFGNLNRTITRLR